MEQLETSKKLLAEIDNLCISEPSRSKFYKKIARKIKADAAFLERHKAKAVSLGTSIESPSSNLPYITGVLSAVKESTDVQEVICELKQYNVIVDVICDGGKTWKKVIARNPQSLHLIWAGKGQYGTKDIVKKAHQYLRSAQLYRRVSPPHLSYIFCNGVTHDMAEALESLGITVFGEKVPVSQETLARLKMALSDSDSDDEDLFEKARRQPEQLNEEVTTQISQTDNLIGQLTSVPSNQKIFLDITCMLVYISHTCNGGCDYPFEDEVLLKQAQEEREGSALQRITPYFDGSRVLISCQSAVNDYRTIVRLSGGPNEQTRAAALLKLLTIVPDCVSQRFLELRPSSQIKQRSQIIFGTADKLACDILTSNIGFVRAASGQGIEIPAIIHESRALSEQKSLAKNDGA